MNVHDLARHAAATKGGQTVRVHQVSVMPGEAAVVFHMDGRISLVPGPGAQGTRAGRAAQMLYVALGREREDDHPLGECIQTRFALVVGEQERARAEAESAPATEPPPASSAPAEEAP